MLFVIVWIFICLFCLVDINVNMENTEPVKETIDNR